MTEPSINEREILGAYAAGGMKPHCNRVSIIRGLLAATAIAALIVSFVGCRDHQPTTASVDQPAITTPAARPNIHAAIGHALLAASDISGRDQIEQFFRDEVGKIVARHAPVDIGGKIKAKCQDDMAATINSLMDNP